jgi:hypothetical protein
LGAGFFRVFADLFCKQKRCKTTPKWREQRNGSLRLHPPLIDSKFSSKYRFSETSPADSH